MKVITFGNKKEEIEELLKKHGFKLAEDNPDFVVSYGGDGTLMQSEHAFPGIPKIILKNSAICKMCCGLSNEQVLELVKEKKYKIENLIKIKIEASGPALSALNDITIHNADPRHAVRYHLWVNGKQIGGQIIGDGVVVATPFGSTAYYRSITDSYFEVGIGIAFNNSTEQSDHIVLKDDSIIEMEIMRGPAVAYADNQKEKIELGTGDKIKISKSKEEAKIVRLVTQ